MILMGAREFSQFIFLLFSNMKKALILSVTLLSTTTSSLFAMEEMSGAMMHDAMMKKDDTMMMSHNTMKKDTMMKADTMMKKDTMMVKKSSVAQTALAKGYNWNKDRKMLAKKAGITQYTGTTKQNLMIQSYLSTMADGAMMKDDAMMQK
jgi:hypothetical protein